MREKLEKTNAMRILEQKRLPYQCLTYESGMTNASQVAAALGQPPGTVFKTLVTAGKSGEHYVFMVPAGKDLDLKKAAKAAGEKSLEMILQKELFPLTGYIHGGCSPIGMKKQFRTFIDSSAAQLDAICFSGGRVGCQLQMKLEDLRQAVPVIPADLIKLD